MQAQGEQPLAIDACELSDVRPIGSDGFNGARFSLFLVDGERIIDKCAAEEGVEEPSDGSILAGGDRRVVAETACHLHAATQCVMHEMTGQPVTGGVKAAHAFHAQIVVDYHSIRAAEIVAVSTRRGDALQAVREVKIVDVPHHHPLAARGIQRPHARVAAPAIDRIGDQADAWILHGAHCCGGGIGRAVVDHHPLPILERLRLQRGVAARYELGAVIDRRNDGECRAHVAALYQDRRGQSRLAMQLAVDSEVSASAQPVQRPHHAMYRLIGEPVQNQPPGTHVETIPRVEAQRPPQQHDGACEAARAQMQSRR